MSLAQTGNEGAKPNRGAAFTRKNKLVKANDFKKVFRKPVVSSDSCFKVLARPNSVGYARLGMAVSRTVDSRAVVRNRIKRVIRESFRQRLAADRPCIDVVVLPRRETATICNERLFASLNAHWSRLDRQIEGLRTDGKS